MRVPGVIKPYADFLAACGKLYLEQSAYDNMEEWAANPIHGLSFEKPPNDSSTSVIVRCTRSATGNDLADETEETAAAAANIVLQRRATGEHRHSTFYIGGLI